MIYKESFNSDVYLLVLGRPADPLCTTLSAFLSQQRYAFSVCSSIYQVLGGLESVSDCQTAILITRPAMLVSQAALFLSKRFRNLKTVGWLDSNENLSDAVVAQAVGTGMVMVCSCDQLRQVIPSLCTPSPRDVPMQHMTEMETVGKLDPLEYELCDDEMNALLGVE